MRRARLLATAGAIAGAALLLVATFLAGRASAPRPQTSFHPLTFRRGFVFSARFLPDGASAIYGASWEGTPTRVFVTDLEVPEPRALDLPPADVFAASRRSELLLGLGRVFLYDWLTGSTLAVAPIGGSAPREAHRRVIAADWAPDGERYAMARSEGRGHLLEFPAGRVLYRTPGWIGDLRVLPDDRRVVFLDHPTWGDRRGHLSIADSSGARPLVDADFETLSGLAIAPGGREVLFSAARTGARTEIFAATLSTGRVRPVLRAPGSLRVLDVSEAGRVLLSRDELRQSAIFRRGEGPTQELLWTGNAQVAALSSDGARALLTVYGEKAGGTGVAWLRRTDGAPAVRLGDGDATDLSPDGLWGVAIRHGDIDSLVLLPTSPGDPRTLVLPRAVRYHWARFTPDGQRLVVSANEPGRKIRLYMLELSTGDSRPVTPEGVGFLSPIDAAGAAVTSQDLDGKMKLFPFAGGPPRDIPGLLADEDVLFWLPDDVACLAARRNEVPLRVFRVEIPSGARTLHTEAAPADREGLRSVTQATFSRDGTAVAYNISRHFSELFVADGLR